MKKHSKHHTIAWVGIVVTILLIGARVWRQHQIASEATDPIEAMIDSMPQAPETASPNEKIRFALETFQNAANKNNGGFESLCKGGFINTNKSAYQKIADEIVSNRILNAHPLEFAQTQDEAGITCISSNEHWVLFTALNEEGNQDYFCVDSASRKGKYGVDREGMKCQ